MLQLEYKGVYSTADTENAQAGSTNKLYWLIWFADNQTVMIQALTAEKSVSGKQYRLRMADFLSRFEEEEDFLLPPQVLAHAHLVEHEARTLPDEPYQFVLKNQDGDDITPELVTSEQAYDVARKDAEEFERQPKTPERIEGTLKASFEEALSALEQGNRRDALKLFSAIADNTDGVVPEHKHVFADFGTDLRKQKLPAAALKHQLKVVELSPEDDHALFNVARVYYDMGDYGNTIRYLNKAIRLNKDLRPAHKFLEYVREQRRAEK